MTETKTNLTDESGRNINPVLANRFLWEKDNDEKSMTQNWYLHYKGQIAARVMEANNLYKAFTEHNLKGEYFDTLIEAKRWCEKTVC